MNDRERAIEAALRAAGRAIVPPPGAWERALARAQQAPLARPRWSIARPLAGMSAAVVVALGGSLVAYAAPPDAPTFGLQRAIDGAALAAPLPAQLRIQLQTNVAERRARQAASVAAHAPATLTETILGDAAAFFEAARTAARGSAPNPRAKLLRAIADAEQRAATILRGIDTATTAVQERAAEFDREASDDMAAEHEAEQEIETERESGPRPSAEPERSPEDLMPAPPRAASDGANAHETTAPETSTPGRSPEPAATERPDAGATETPTTPDNETDTNPERP